MKKISCYITVVFMSAQFFSSCKKQEAENPEHIITKPSTSAMDKAWVNSPKVYVSNVAQLYEAINNPLNIGATLELAAGTYMLSANYPKAGRLELQHNMSLVGQPDQPGAVIIDATQLPLSSFTMPPTNARTGVVRMGDGDNSIAWITFQNDPAHTIRSLIQTDIIATPVARIRIANCIIKGSSIGISIVNREPSANGRTIEAEIEDNEIMQNIIPQFGSGIQIQNSMAVNNATIRVNMRRNFIHDNKAGILAFNASSKQSVIDIQSFQDTLESNGLGIMFNGGFIENAGNEASDNLLKFEAHVTSVKNNVGIPAPPFSFPAGGVYASGGQAMPPFAAAGTAHRNQLEVSFYACNIKDNIGANQVMAFGGHSFHPALTTVGTYNSTYINLHGLSKKASVQAEASVPYEPAGTNSVFVN